MEPAAFWRDERVPIAVDRAQHPAGGVRSLRSAPPPQIDSQGEHHPRKRQEQHDAVLVCLPQHNNGGGGDVGGRDLLPRDVQRQGQGLALRSDAPTRGLYPLVEAALQEEAEVQHGLPPSRTNRGNFFIE